MSSANMESNSPVFTLGPGSISSNCTISDLIAFTRTAFLPSDFEMVEDILIDREEAQYCEVQRLKLEMEEKLEKKEKEKERLIEEKERLMKVVNDKDEMINRLNREFMEKEAFDNHKLGRYTSGSQDADIIKINSDDEGPEVNKTNPILNTLLHKRKRSSHNDDYDDDDDDASVSAGEQGDDVADAGPTIRIYDVTPEGAMACDDKRPTTSDRRRRPNDGGPIDKSILVSFKDHIAYADGKEEKRRLNTICHWSKLKEWNLSEEVEGVQSRVRATGLTPLIEHNYRYFDYVAIQAFVERWQPETNSFHFPFGEMAITLDDISQILGVPVVGICFNSTERAKDIQPDVAIKMASELLGVHKSKVVKETEEAYAVRLTWLKENCAKKAKKNSSEEELDNCARAYILYLLGCIIFPDKCKNKVSIYYLGGLRDLKKVGQIGWGTAILAYMYRPLGHASRSKVKWISGCLTLVVAWICEHFPDCVRRVINTQYTEDQPRMCRWKPQQCSGDTKTALGLLREKLDDLTYKDVCWDPYRDQRVQRPIHEVSWYFGLLICFDVAEPYYPDRVLRQFGRVQAIPKMPIIQPTNSARGNTVKKYKVVYDQSQWEFNNWSSRCLTLAQELRSRQVKYDWEYEPNYIDWFLKITHPIIQPRSERNTKKSVRGDNNIANQKLVQEVD